MRAKWVFNEFRWLFIRVLHVLTGKYYINTEKLGKYTVFNGKDGNALLKEYIMKGEPFSFCRFSFVELGLLINMQRDRLFGTKLAKRNKIAVETFQIEGKAEQGLYQFEDIMKRAIKEADFLGIWGNLAMGDCYLSNYYDLQQKVLADATCVEPYAYEEPWSYALKGKKVLVVSPFSQLIQKQYEEKRDKIFANPKILPAFELLTVDSIWYSAAGKDKRFSDWFEAYDFLYSEIMKQNFDIALLGCGPFGFPLAAKIKLAGKQAIHMGGAIQILFGIKGSRWDNTTIGEMYNEYWVRPSKKTAPEQAEKLDNFCYW